MAAYEDKDFLAILKQHWGYDGFRGAQLAIIRSIAEGHDTLGLMPTGGGKSITFQVPALLQEGMCVVVSPLIALMKDQVLHLRRRGICATAIYSGMEQEDIRRETDNCVYGANKFLYISPERLATEYFRKKIKKMPVSMITVDEAHCISQWGYDFRPPYLEIAKIRELLPDVPILALTATATPRVVEDICDKLAFRKGYAVHKMSFMRDNLSYVVRKTDNKWEELLHILRAVPGSAIVYTRNRKKTRETAKELKAKGISALFYHAGLTNLDKDVRQNMWIEDEARVMVATNAFGMGIDKSDVRLVVHIDVPDSIEAYFQEAGRAGRDGKKAYAVLLTDGSDGARLSRRVDENYPDPDYIRKVYDHICYYFELAVGDGFQVRYPFDLEKFCVRFHFFPTPVISALQLLTRAGYIDYQEESDASSRVQMLINKEELYQIRSYREDDGVLQYLLRHCCGLFSDYVKIDESVMAAETALSRHEVYESLKRLTRERILHYIPRKNIPHITFLQRRVESKHLAFPPEVYARRKEEYAERIDAMLDYLSKDDLCRSRSLLAYFGEEDSVDCRQCDVCYAHKRSVPYPAELPQKLMAVLSDGQSHGAEDFRLSGYSEQAIAVALRTLADEEKLICRDGRYRRVEEKE